MKISTLILLIALSGCVYRNSNDEKESFRINNNVNLENSNEYNVSGSNGHKIKVLRFVKATTEYMCEEDTVTKVIGENKYTLYPDGKIAVSTSSDRTDTFRLNTEMVISHAYFYTQDNHFIVFYTETDSDCSASFIECFDKNGYELIWKNAIGGFNLADPCIVDSNGYVSSIGFAGKLNLNNGKFYWKHDDLYEKYSLFSFDGIRFDGENVCFIASKIDEKNKGILFNDETGHFVGIDRK